MPTPSAHPHKRYMERCFDLAIKGGKHTKCNPLVGSVVVHKDRIIGEGYHQLFGSAHAEVNAINSISDKNKKNIASSTLYVSLEPCSHQGKTPPCAEMIVDIGIKKVVIGCMDPNPLVAGKGIAFLEKHGVEVIAPFMPEKAEKIISKFKANLAKRPYITLKWAQSHDHFFSKVGTQTWLTNAMTSIFTHKKRTEVDAILIGKNTALIDNPSLTARYYEGDNPTRIVLDKDLSLPDDLHIYSDTYPTITLHSVVKTQPNNKKTCIYHPDLRDLSGMMKLLFDMGIYSLIVEGGAQVLSTFIHQKIWDEAMVISTDKFLEFGIPAPTISGAIIQTYTIGSDRIELLKNTYDAV